MLHYQLLINDIIIANIDFNLEFINLISDSTNLSKLKFT